MSLRLRNSKGEENSWEESSGRTVNKGTPREVTASAWLVLEVFYMGNVDRGASVVLD